MISAPAPIAYVYVRFSSAAQGDGDSETRQMRDVLAWCERRGLAIDPTRVLTDRGRSGFAGAHLARGELGRFVRMVETGRVQPGSVLVVEHLDRISRLPLSEARRIIELLLGHDIQIGVVGTDEMFDRRSSDDLSAQVVLMVRIDQAHKESALKRQRQISIWQGKRARARQTREVATKGGPRWLDYDAERRVWVSNEHAGTVTRIFDLAITGHGSNAIAATLNRDNVPRLAAAHSRAVGRGGIAARWLGTSVMQILRSSSAHGAWMPRTVSREMQRSTEETVDGTVTRYKAPITYTDEGEAIPDYYPAVVSRATWDAAQRAIASRVDGGGNKGRMASVLQGVLFCAHCGGRLQRNSHRCGYKSQGFYCHAAYQGKCDARGSIKAEPLCEDVLQQSVRAFDFVDHRRDPERDRAYDGIAALERQRDQQQAALDSLSAALTGSVSSAVAQQFGRMSEAIDRLDREIADQRRRLLALDMSGTKRPAEFTSLLRDYIVGTGEARDRAIRLLNAALRQVIERIDVEFGKFRGCWRMFTVNRWAEYRGGVGAHGMWFQDVGFFEEFGAAKTSLPYAARSWEADLRDTFARRGTKGLEVAKRVVDSLRAGASTKPPHPDDWVAPDKLHPVDAYIYR